MQLCHDLSSIVGCLQTSVTKTLLHSHAWVSHYLQQHRDLSLETKTKTVRVSRLRLRSKLCFVFRVSQETLFLGSTAPNYLKR